MAKRGVGLLRELNEKRTLAFLRMHKISSRLEIARFLGVSKNTVSLIIDQLIQDGVVREIGTDDPKGVVGRPKIQITLNPGIYKALGLLVQQKYIQYTVLDYFSNVLESGEVFDDNRDAGNCLELLRGLCQTLLERHPETLGIGIGIPGLIDPEEGIVHYSSRLTWTNVKVKDSLESWLDVPVKVLNRIKAAAIDPAIVELEKDNNNIFYLRIDEGVGGALIVNQDIYHGASWTAGEIGHIPIVPDGPRCACGKNGCLESIVSAPAVERLIAEELGVVQSRGLMDTLAENRGDRRIERTMTQVGSYLGIAVAYIINLLNPHKIIIDSPYAQIDAFTKATVEIAEQMSLSFPYRQTDIQFTQLVASSAIGAGTAVFIDFETDLRLLTPKTNSKSATS